MCFVEAIGEATMNGYYVDEWTGLVCSTSKAPSGCHFEFKVREGYHEVWIVSNKDGEVLQEAVFWESLEALVAAPHCATGIMDATTERTLELEIALRDFTWCDTDETGPFVEGRPHRKTKRAAELLHRDIDALLVTTPETKS